MPIPGQKILPLNHCGVNKCPHCGSHLCEQRYKLYHGNCVNILHTLPSQSVDCVITDPPYAEISRDYGRMTEEAWHEMMDVVVTECRRILKPTGSAVFILQPNSERIGKMRLWMWEFLLKWGKEWGLVQDHYWWNNTTLPLAGCNRELGLMRPSVKMCLWFGRSDCYRDQQKILNPLTERALNDPRTEMNRVYSPSGVSYVNGKITATSRERGGTTPFNLIMTSNPATPLSASSRGHGAGTPSKLCDHWVKYICPIGGTVLDPFAGTSTIGISAIAHKCKYVGIEKMEKYYHISIDRLCANRQLESDSDKPPMMNGSTKDANTGSTNSTESNLSSLWG